MKNEEGKRLGMFVERICKLSQAEFTEEANKEAVKINKDNRQWTQPDISKYINGGLVIPFLLIKVMHRKWKMNYTWFFEGTGPMQLGSLPDRKLSNDVTEILATVLLMEQSMHQLRKTVKVLTREVFALKHDVK